MVFSSATQGRTAETLAQTFLQCSGLHILATNRQYRGGEIDIVALHGDTLVFVEVRYRRSKEYGGAVYSVTSAKQRKLIRAAELFLASEPRYQRHACRFDVVALSGALEHAEIEWIQHAFQLE